MPHFPIQMPQLGESMAEATVQQVLFSAGDEVTADQDLFEVETDKAMMEVTTPCSGTIIDVVAEIGQSYAVGSILAHIEATEEEATKAGLIKPGDNGTLTPSSDKNTDEETSENLHFLSLIHI